MATAMALDMEIHCALEMDMALDIAKIRAMARVMAVAMVLDLAIAIAMAAEMAKAMTMVVDVALDLDMVLALAMVMERALTMARDLMNKIYLYGCGIQYDRNYPHCGYLNCSGYGNGFGSDGSGNKYCSGFATGDNYKYKEDNKEIREHDVFLDRIVIHY